MSSERKIELYANIGWARYWILKAVQQRVPCSDLELQTCPITLLVKRGTKIEGEFARTEVNATGSCAGKAFKANCILWREYKGGPWQIHWLSLSVDGSPERGVLYFKLPDYPSTLEKRIVADAA